MEEVLDMFTGIDIYWQCSNFTLPWLARCCRLVCWWSVAGGAKFQILWEMNCELGFILTCHSFLRVSLRFTLGNEWSGIVCYLKLAAILFLLSSSTFFILARRHVPRQQKVLLSSSHTLPQVVVLPPESQAHP